MTSPHVLVGLVSANGRPVAEVEQEVIGSVLSLACTEGLTPMQVLSKLRLSVPGDDEWLTEPETDALVSDLVKFAQRSVVQ